MAEAGNDGGKADSFCLDITGMEVGEFFRVLRFFGEGFVFRHVEMIYQMRTRCGPVYILKRWSLRKPISVMLHSCASCTARLEGAPTAATRRMPAMAAFCISSKQALPLSRRM